MDDCGAKQLMIAIVKQAASDYKEQVRRLNSGVRSSKAEYFAIRDFFMSDMFYAFSGGVDGEYLVETLDKKFKVDIDGGRKYRYWTENEVEELITRRTSGDTFASIARSLGRDTASCRKKYIKLMKGLKQ